MDAVNARGMTQEELGQLQREISQSMERHPVVKARMEDLQAEQRKALRKNYLDLFIVLCGFLLGGKWYYDVRGRRAEKSEIEDRLANVEHQASQLQQARENMMRGAPAAVTALRALSESDASDERPLFLLRGLVGAAFQQTASGEAKGA
eukprot:tig00000692_g3269.t1